MCYRSHVNILLYSRRRQTSYGTHEVKHDSTHRTACLALNRWNLCCSDKLINHSEFEMSMEDLNEGVCTKLANIPYEARVELESWISIRVYK